MNNKRWNNTRRHCRGYAAMAMVALLGVTALLGIMAVFRQSMRSHEGQVRNQVKIDYRQREDALLRALVAIAPNKAIGAMQQDSAGNASQLSWNQVFVEAIAAAKADEAVSTATLTGLGISGQVIANTGDNASLLPASFVSAIAGTGTLVGEGITANTGLLGSSVAGKLPTPLVYSGMSTAGQSAPIISTLKNYATPDVARFPNYNVIPYPDIRFGFVNQSGDFVAKRNWWAFSMTFGSGVSITNNTGTAASAIPTVTKNYVLSIYEVPAQLAVSAGAKLKLEGGAWATANVDGGVFGAEVDASGLTATGANATISARRSVNLGAGATVGGQSVAAGFDALGTREARWASSGSDMYAASDAGSSGRVAILPLSQGDGFVRRATNSITNTLSDTGWDAYAQGSRRCAMEIEIVQNATPVNVEGPNKPTTVIFRYLDNTGNKQSITYSNPGLWVNHGRDYILVDHDGDDPDNDGKNAGGGNATKPVPSRIPFYWEELGNPTDVAANPVANSRPALGIKLARFPEFLIRDCPGAAPVSPVNPGDVANNSLAVYSNPADPTVSLPQTNPTLATDLGVVIRDAGNLHLMDADGTNYVAYDLRPGFRQGFSLVTDHRVYLVGEINQEPTPAPAGVVLPAGVLYYPPVSIFASEKVFGTSDSITSNGNVFIDGQLTSLQDDDGTVVDPLALKQGTGSASVTVGAINANLTQITSPAQLPPVNKMTWLVTVEEIH